MTSRLHPTPACPSDEDGRAAARRRRFVAALAIVGAFVLMVGMLSCGGPSSSQAHLAIGEVQSSPGSRAAPGRSASALAGDSPSPAAPSEAPAAATGVTPPSSPGTPSSPAPGGASRGSGTTGSDGPAASSSSPAPGTPRLSPAPDPSSTSSTAPSPIPTTIPTPSGPSAFAIVGDVDGLVPGRWVTIRLTIVNLTAHDLGITAITTAVDPESAPPGCESATNLLIRQADVSSASPLRLAAASSIVVDTPNAPQIQLLDLPDVNQDACRGTTFTLEYVGTATW